MITLQERLRHEEEIEHNNGVWMRQELQAVAAPEDAARTKGIRRGVDKVTVDDHCPVRWLSCEV